MELRQLRYFEAVGRLLNFSKAAEELHMAQPPLSRQIQNLEDELGVTLIDRSSRPLKMTNAGQFFYDQSVQVLARIAEVKRATQQLGAEQKRWMGIGFTPSVLYSHIPKAIQQFGSHFPNVHISLSELTSVQQADALKSGRIDVGFGRLAINSEGIENIILTEDTLMLAVPANHPMAAQTSVSMADIAAEKLILYPASPRPSLADQILSHFKVRGLELSDTFETNSLQTAMGLVAANMGVTILPQSVQLMQRPDLVYVAIDAADMCSPLIMSVRANDESDHLLAFRQHAMINSPTE